MHVPNKVKDVTNRRFLLEIMDFFLILINRQENYYYTVQMNA